MKDASFWEEVERAKRMTPQQRFMGTVELNDYVLDIVRAGVRMQNPDADEAQLKQLVHERYELARKLDSGK